MAALSWDELSADHKIVFLLESLANAPQQQSPIACRVCDKIFFDNTSLLEHFLSHFNEDGSLKGRQQHVGTNFVARPNLSRPLGHGAFGAHPHQASNFHSRFAGRQHPHVPIRPTVANEQPNYNFRHSDPGTTRWNPRRILMKNMAEGASSGYTRPYINLLERPVQQTVPVEDNNLNEMDLTLKL